MNLRQLAVAGGFLLMSSAVVADTYYWLPADRTIGDATDLNNWSVQFDTSARRPVADAHPTHLPTESDVIDCHTNLCLDLGGQSIGAASLPGTASDPYRGGVVSWGECHPDYVFTNGTLTVKGNVNLRPKQSPANSGDAATAGLMRVLDGATVVIKGAFIPGDGMGGDGKMPIWIENGGTLDVSQGSYLPYNGLLTVNPGGTLRVGNMGLAGGTGQPGSYIKNHGTATFGSGCGFLDSGACGAAAARLLVEQVEGVMTIDGPVTGNGKSSTFTFTWKGGTLRTEDMLYFASDAHATTASGVAITGDVAVASATMDCANLAFGSGVTFVKTGPGSVTFGTGWPEGLTVEEGFLKFAEDSSACPIVPVIGANGGLLFGARNARLDAAEIAEGAAFALDLSAVTIGDTILISSSDELLDTVCAGLNAWCAAERVAVGVRKAGGALEVTARAEHTFDATSGKPLSDPTGWGEDEVPVGAAVDVAGAGVVDISGDTPAFSSIRVRDGATLRVVGGAADALVRLPSVQLVGNARLKVAGGAFAELKPGENLATIVAGDALPVFEIETNGYVYASGVESAGPKAGSFRNDITFKNVDMRICGTLETPVAYVWCQTGDPDWPTRYVYLNLGQAGVNETVRFALTCDGGTISLRNYSWNYGYAYLRIACAASDGRVVAERPLVFRNCDLPVYSGPKGNRDLSGLEVGVGNPDDEPVVIEAERTVFDVSDTSTIGGAVDFRFGWGATLRRKSFVQTHSINLFVKDKAKLSFAGTDFYFGRVLQGQGREIDVSSAGIDGEVMSFTNSNFATWRVKGDGTPRKVTFADSRWYLGNWIIDQNLGSNGDASSATYNTKPTAVFAGFTEAEIPTGTTFTLLGTNYTWGSSLDIKKFTRMHWDRKIDFSPTAAITGGGNILVSNNAPTNSMTATLRGALNTCTGELAAEPGTRSTLRIADGANWAGTVVANGCAQLGAADGEAAPAKASFGSIRFAGNFPVRVWRRDGALTGDGLDLAAAVSGQGAFEVVCMDGCEPVMGESYEFGRYPANAALPRVRGRWMFTASPSDDPDFVTLRLVHNQKGLMLLFR